MNKTLLSENDSAYIEDIVYGVHHNSEHIRYCQETPGAGILPWISKIDLSILKLSIYEICLWMTYHSAYQSTRRWSWQKYSGEEAGSFINGILSKLAEIKKSAEK